jgi:uncharacterized membrane protein YtjA (UPF0391 family)
MFVGAVAGGRQERELSMLYWALVFLVISIIAAVFGFGRISEAAAGIAKILFFIFIVIFVVLLLVSLFSGHAPTTP